MSDLEELDDIADQTSTRVNWKEDARGAKHGTHNRKIQRRQPFAAAKRHKQAPITLPKIDSNIK